jgi:hypothetical protein
MKQLCIQIQPHRAAGIDIAAIRSLCERLAGNREEIERYGAFEGTDQVEYINLMFETKSVAALWSLLQIEFYGHPLFGSLLLKSSMAMCQGDYGWDDYHQLYHFDPTVELSTPPGD